MRYLKLDARLITDTRISGNDMRVYAYILDLYNEKEKCAYPAIETMAKALGLSESTIKKSIKLLEELKYLTIGKRRGKAGNYNIYENLKHHIKNVVKPKEIKEEIQGNTQEIKKEFNNGIEIGTNVSDVNITKEEITIPNKLDNHENVRLARAVTNIDRSKFAKKVLSLADNELVREAIIIFKKKKGKSAAFLINILADIYLQGFHRFPKGLENLLIAGLGKNVHQIYWNKKLREKNGEITCENSEWNALELEMGF